MVAALVMFTRTVRFCRLLMSAARAMTRMRPSSISLSPIGMVDHAASIWPVMPAVKLGVTPPTGVGLASSFSCASSARRAAWLDDPATE